MLPLNFSKFTVKHTAADGPINKRLSDLVNLARLAKAIQSVAILKPVAIMIAISQQ